MAEWHLKDLQTALACAGWRVEAELPGNDYNISGTWKVTRGKSEEIFIDFDGLDDMATLPIEQSYGCGVRGRPAPKLYFGRMGAKGSDQRTGWQSVLRKFVSELETSVR